VHTGQPEELCCHQSMSQRWHVRADNRPLLGPDQAERIDL
jgi:hypothetical protein